MREIPVKYWTALTNDGAQTKENTVGMLNVLLNNLEPKSIPSGFDQFRIFSRITKVIEKFEKSEKKVKSIELEEVDYMFLKGMIEDNIPAYWGASPSICEAVDSFMGAKKVKGSKKDGTVIKEE